VSAIRHSGDRLVQRFGERRASAIVENKTILPARPFDLKLGTLSFGRGRVEFHRRAQIESVGF
jgi:hypothetical protein